MNYDFMRPLPSPETQRAIHQALNEQNDALASQAETIFSQIRYYIELFSENLAEDEAVSGIMMTSGAAHLIRIENITFSIPTLIIFEGELLPIGDKVTLIQNVSQFNLLLKAVKVTQDTPKREIGFKYDNLEYNNA